MNARFCTNAGGGEIILENKNALQHICTSKQLNRLIANDSQNYIHDHYQNDTSDFWRVAAALGVPEVCRNMVNIVNWSKFTGNTKSPAFSISISTSHFDL